MRGHNLSTGRGIGRGITALVLFALIAVLLPAPLTASAQADPSFRCTLRAEGNDAILEFSGAIAGNHAHLRDQDGWVIEVTSRASYRDAGGVDGDYHVVMRNPQVIRVPCTAEAVDFTCSTLHLGDDAMLYFWGDGVGATAAVFIGDRWQAQVTGETQRLMPGGANGAFRVWLRDTRQSVECDATVTAEYSCTSLAQDGDARLFFWGDAAETTSANVLDSTGWLETVTGETTYLATDEATETYVVKLHNLRTTVACDSTVPTDFSCSVVEVGDTAQLTFSGSAVDRGRSANVLQDGTWIQTVTGRDSHFVQEGAGSSYVVKLHNSATAVACAQISAPPSSSGPYGQTGDWVLDFEDNFDGDALNLDLWEPVWYNGTVNERGFQRSVNNNENACYHADQAVVSGGMLRLSLDAETDPLCQIKDGSVSDFVGAQITTRSFRADERYETTSGYFEARIFLPSTNGDLHNWPGFWVNGREWPTQGEIDIMEGLRERQPCASFHYADENGRHRHNKTCADYAEPGGWHIFAADWGEGELTFYYDGVELGSAPAGTVTNEPHFMSLQYTTNTDWGTPALDTMLVDYVRVWQRD